MQSPFRSSDILLPSEVEYEKWSVIACDQFTSDRQYWDRVQSATMGAKSTFNMVFPEIDLENNPKERIASIAHAMESNDQAGTFKLYPNAFVYVERTLLNGTVRPGIVGMVDLEQYHYDPSKKPAIGATEQTVLERVPPRIAVRREALLEFPHIILFCNDAGNHLMQPVTEMKSRLPLLYDFDLMEGGGHISGWLISGEDADSLQKQIDNYHKNAVGTAFLVADGNHSLVTAKCWYEELKEKNPGADLSAHPARYALVELENILDPSISFEPIHRVIFDTDPERLLKDMAAISSENGCEIPWYIGDKKGTVRIDVPKGQLPVAVLQKFLDQWLSVNAGRIDYIHDTDAVEAFAKQENAIGLLLPVFDKTELFEFGASGKILPRKTFSLGHSREKRYYLEGRKIR